MLDRTVVTPSAEWPPAFAETFIEQARGLLDLSQVLMILGPVGGSAHTLATAIVDAPGGADTPLWSHHVASSGDSREPFHAIGRLFTVDTEHATGPGDVENGIRAELAACGENSPTVVIANADLCDRESVDVLTRLAATGTLRLILTLAPESIAALGQLATAAEVVELPPLESETVGEMIRIRYSAAPEPALVDLLMERTKGSYEVLCDVVDLACQDRQLTVLGDQLVLDHDLSGIAAAVLAEDLSQLTAILGQLDAAEATALMGDSVVSRALASAVLERVDGHIAFSSAVEARRARWSISHERLTELFDLYAQELPATTARPDSAIAAADWWLAAGQLPSPELASRAARQANLLGQPRRAIMFTDAGRNTSHNIAAPLERAHAMAEVGDSHGVTTIWTSIDPELLTEDELLPYLRWVHHLTDTDRRDRLATHAVQADDAKAADRRAATGRLALLVDRAFRDGATELAGPLRELAFSDLLSIRNRALAFGALAAVLLNSGRPAQAAEMGQLAGEILKLTPDQVSASHLDPVREVHVRALISALDVTGAENALQGYAQVAGASDDRLTLMLRALLETMRGNMHEAITSLRRGLASVQPRDPHHLRSWGQAHLADLLTRCGQNADAHLALQRSAQHTLQDSPYDLDRQIAQAAALDALAEPEDALSLLQEVVTEAKERRLFLLKIEAAARSVLIGGPPLVKVLTEAVDGLEELTGVPAVWQRFAAAARSYDIAVLTRLIDDLVSRRAFGLAAELAQFVLDMSRRATDLDAETRDWLRSLAERQESS